MELPDKFRFSQNNLQDFSDCPRRFELKYLLKQEWPAVVSEPILEFEQHQQLGRSFHTLIQRHLAGIPAHILEDSLIDPLLHRWWKNYLLFIKPFQTHQFQAEVTKTIPFAGYHLTATYDCLVLDTDHSITILDWKTSHFKTSAKTLANRIQSLVYPFIYYETHKDELSAENISLIYWFPEYPDEPVKLRYSSNQHTDAGVLLHDLIESITNNEPGGFPLTDNEKTCQYCIYRSLCNRGVKAGCMADAADIQTEPVSQLDSLDFNSIEEIQF